ncbi:hypothetical protein BGX26_011879 [Mortierella sp. AD094]|nr:hypothetical protein BGX26_011879 [Mortierella sp. AD094]
MFQSNGVTISYEIQLASDLIDCMGIANNPLAKLINPETENGAKTAAPIPFSVPVLPRMPARASLTTSSRTADLVRESNLNASQTSSKDAVSWSTWFWTSLGYPSQPASEESSSPEPTYYLYTQPK